MSISVNCPKCNTLHNLGDELSGKNIKCKECTEIIQVPALAAYEDYAQSSSPYPPPADYPQFPTSEEYRYQDEQDPGMRMLFPIGRSGFAIAAGYGYSERCS